MLNLIQSNDGTDMNFLPSIFGAAISPNNFPMYLLAEQNFSRLLEKHIEDYNGGIFTFAKIKSDVPDQLNAFTGIAYIDSDKLVQLSNPENYTEVETTLKAASIAVWLKTILLFGYEYFNNTESGKYRNYTQEQMESASARLFEIYNDLKCLVINSSTTINNKESKFLTTEEISAIDRFLD